MSDFHEEEERRYLTAGLVWMLLDKGSDSSGDSNGGSSGNGQGGGCAGCGYVILLLALAMCIHICKWAIQHYYLTFAAAVVVVYGIALIRAEPEWRSFCCIGWGLIILGVSTLVVLFGISMLAGRIDLRIDSEQNGGKPVYVGLRDFEFGRKPTPDVVINNFLKAVWETPLNAWTARHPTLSYALGVVWLTALGFLIQIGLYAIIHHLNKVRNRFQRRIKRSN